ncbi:MAG: xanthine dehydrogenase family protein subunit M [Myxococcota bacterium]
MKPFTYEAPKTLADAVAALKHDDGAKLMSGGQSLIPILKLELATPSTVVALSGLSELRGVKRDGDALWIGAMTTHAAVANSDEVRAHLPALADLASKIGDPAVRNRGTLGGSVAHADPAADYPAALLALNATVHTDRRTIAADAFFKGLMETALAADEIITGVTFRVPRRAAYAKFPHPASRFAVVGVMVAAFADGVRVAVTGAGAHAFRVPAMEAALTKKLAADALDGIAVAADDLQSDMDFSAEYRAHLCGVLARRAVSAIA